MIASAPPVWSNLSLTVLKTLRCACHNAGRRHLNVCLVDSVQVWTAWRDNLRMRYASVETGLHDGASSEYANSS